MGASPSPTPGQPQAEPPNTPPAPNAPAPPAVPVPPVPPADNRQVYFTESQVQERVVAARQEEKTKLYSDLEAGKNKLQTAQRELAALKKAHPAPAEGAEAQQQHNAEITQLSQQIATLTETMGTLNGKYEQAMVQALEQQKVGFDKMLQQRDVEAHRQLILTRNTDGESLKLIPELLVGGTVEELNAAEQLAKSAYQRAFETGSKAKETELQPLINGSVPKPASPGSPAPAGSPNSPTAPTADLGAWRKMSPKDWEAHKEAVKQQAFSNAGLPMKK